MKITKIIGFPGTGKTSYLQNIIEEKIALGADIHDIVFTSFSRATMRNILDRLEDMGYTHDELNDTFRTLHSLSARALDLKDKEKFVRSQDYEMFCNNYGIQYQPFYVKTINEIDQFGTIGEDPGQAPGNILFNWWQFLKKKCVYDGIVRNAILQQKCIEYEELSKLSNYSPEYMLQLYDAWEEYKKYSNKWEYDDMLAYIVSKDVPFYREIKYFIIDEVQDINKLQFELINLWSKYCEELITAGDPYQAIYFFAAADPKLMDKFDGEPKVLPQSYRVPKIPWQSAYEVSKFIGCGDTLMKDVRPADIEGSLRYLNYEDAFNTIIDEYNSKSKTFLLFRTHQQIKNFLSICFDDKIYIMGMGRAKTCFNSPNFRSIYNTVQKLYLKEPLNMNDIRTFITSIPAKFLIRGVKTRLQGKTAWREQKRLFNYRENSTTDLFFSFFRQTGDVEGIKTIIDDPKTRINNKKILLDISPTSPPIRDNIFIGTYFAAKGLEAENVFCFDYFPRRNANIRRDEARLVFVGLTRTLLNDYVVTPDGYYEDGIIHDLTN